MNAIVEKAIERNTGARGLRSIIENIMRDIMFDIPSNPNIEKCIITKEAVEGKVPPTLVYCEEKKEDDEPKTIIKKQKTNNNQKNIIA